MEKTETYQHALYKHQTEKSEADAVAWAFVNKEKFIEFPFSFPELGANEIRANVLYAGLCLSDSMHCRAKWGTCTYPIAPGHETIAEVSQIGSSVQGFSVGDKVAFGTMRDICGSCKYCSSGRGEPLCTDSPHPFTYGDFWGGYATQLQQPADFFIKVPQGLDLERSAPLLCAGITVYTPIKKYLRKNDVAAVFGVGGLGHLAVQFMNKMGNDVYGVTTSPEKRDFILSLGAKDIVVSTDDKSMAEHKGKFDFIIDTIHTLENFKRRFDLLAKDGTYVILGLGEVGEENTDATSLKIDVFDLVIG